MALNQTTIEGWEIERHEALLRRARTLGGFLHGPNGQEIRIEHQEFPWDIGIWSNLCSTMGTRNPVAWLWPFARSLDAETGLHFEHNEIEGRSNPSASHLCLSNSRELFAPRPFETMATARSRSNVPRPCLSTP